MTTSPGNGDYLAVFSWSDGTVTDETIVKRLVVTLHDDGRVEVTGPVDETVLCYGLLGLARDLVAQRFVARQSGRVPQIVVPRLVEPT